MRMPIVLRCSMYLALSTAARSGTHKKCRPHRCMESPVLYCQYNSITSVECGRVVTLVVVKALTKVCDDSEVVPSLLGEECPCARFRGVNMDHKVFIKTRELEHGRLGEQLIHCCFTVAYAWSCFGLQSLATFVAVSFFVRAIRGYDAV